MYIVYPLISHINYCIVLMFASFAFNVLPNDDISSHLYQQLWTYSLIIVKKKIQLNILNVSSIFKKITNFFFVWQKKCFK